MDLLKQATLAFRDLIHINYIITIGRKNKNETFVINFDKSEFLHLSGLHKLKDIRELKGGKAEIIFDRCLSEEITMDKLSKSKFIDKSIPRLNIIIHYALIMNIPNKYCKFRIPLPGSKLKYDYSLEFDEKIFGVSGYIFYTENRSNPGYLINTSCFSKDDIDHHMRQTNYKLLQVKRVDNRDSSNEIIYQFENYIEEINS